MPPVKSRWLEVTLAALGLAFLLGSGVTYIRTRRFVSNAVSATGVVTRVEIQRGTQGGRGGRVESTTTHVTHIAFTSGSGGRVEFRALVGPGPRVGDTVPVAYDPRNPARAEVRDPSIIWNPVWVLLGAGAMCLATAAFASYDRRGRRPWERAG